MLKMTCFAAELGIYIFVYSWDVITDFSLFTQKGLEVYSNVKQMLEVASAEMEVPIYMQYVPVVVLLCTAKLHSSTIPDVCTLVHVLIA